MAHFKKYLSNPWLHIATGAVVGLVVGGLIARWHYTSQASCGPIDYYDKSGTTKLYSDTQCSS